MVTASKVSATVNPSRSPYQSFYGLWLEFHANLNLTTINEEAAKWGHAAEDFLAAWFQGNHPELNVKDPHRGSPKTWLYGKNERLGATPDRVLVQGGYVVGLLEIKTARHSEGWGAEGTEEIPAHYYDQVQWQMLCTGTTKTYVQAMVMGSPKEYVVEANKEHQDMLFFAATDFLALVDSGKEIDVTDTKHHATYEAVRASQPWIELDKNYEAPDALAEAYIQAVTGKKEAEKALQEAKAQLYYQMGTAQNATWQGAKIATRRHTKKHPAPGDTPTLYPARTLPTINQALAA